MPLPQGLLDHQLRSHLGLREDLGFEAALQALCKNWHVPPDTIQEVGGLVAFVDHLLREREAQQQELVRSEATYRAVVENVREVIFQMDLNGRFVFLNPAWAHVTGFEVAASLGKVFTEFVTPEDRDWSMAHLQTLLHRQGPREQVEVRCLTREGGIRYVEAYARVMRSPEGEPLGLTGTLNDITERKRGESALLQAQKLESLGVLAGGVAHDFNNLLVAILGNAELAANHLDNPPRAARYLAQVQAASARAGDLCRQLLAYSGKGRFLVEALDLNQVVRELSDLLRISIHKGATLEVELAAELPSVEADATQIRQAIMNLVINASDAIAPHTGHIRLRTGVGALPPSPLEHPHLSHDLPQGEVVWLEVTDTGCGMDQQTLDRIFDPFFTTKFTGRGLGLAAILGIVRSHRGALQVSSRPGQGTTFLLCLPHLGTPAAVEVPRDIAPYVVDLQGTVLVADDESGVRDLLQDALTDLGLTVLQASHGQEALAQFRAYRETLDLVLLDLTMPVMGGDEVYRHLRQEAPDLPILLMSGFSEQESLTTLPGAHLAGFLQKPFPLKALRERVHTIFAEARWKR